MSGLMTHSRGKINVPKNVFNGFPKESPFQNKRFDTCSVVGNGGILKGSGCGKKIDGSEFVFRFNMAPMGDKYSRDIGNKTSLITINPSMIGYRYTKGKRKGIDVKSFTHDLSVYGDSYLWIWAFLSKRHASGAFKVQEALRATGARNQMCEEVRLYGFWPFHADRNNQRLNEHYYDNALPTKVHKIPRHKVGDKAGFEPTTSTRHLGCEPNVLPTAPHDPTHLNPARSKKAVAGGSCQAGSEKRCQQPQTAGPRATYVPHLCRLGSTTKNRRTGGSGGRGPAV
ncbi:hypothetical protein Bbelb_054560 [Branchiostoma belcheri]|nr:hypothetical protein Bbelb_054560 [Branchiostoma belcheri]